MDATHDGQSFGQQHFAAAQLGDQRRTDRLVELADRMCRHPSGTLPQKLSAPADLVAFYRLCQCPQVTHEAVLAPHREQTLAAMRQHEGVVLVIHDATELDYTKKKSLRRLGQIGNGYRRGYVAHHSLAVDAQHGSVIGLVNQILHCRPRVPKGEKQAQRRRRRNRESRLWLQGAQAVGPMPEGKRWIDVCDRGADTFEFLDYERQQQRSFVIRSAYNRRLAGTKRRYLHTFARRLPLLGTRTIEVPARAGRPARTAQVGIAAAAVAIKAPYSKNGEHGDEPVAVWIVRVWELAPPAAEQKLEWFLITTESATSWAEALQVVEWYERRWIIEEYHKGLKTGMGIEKLQFKSEAAQEPAIALLSVVGLTLLKLRELARNPKTKDLPATTILAEDYSVVLSAWRYRQRRPLTIQEFHWALARLGGHQNRPSGPRPGWIVLWRGWMELQAMVAGARVMRRKNVA
jgi:Transposase DNA-binding/Transposase DDE domain